MNVAMWAVSCSDRYTYDDEVVRRVALLRHMPRDFSRLAYLPLLEDILWPGLLESSAETFLSSNLLRLSVLDLVSLVDLSLSSERGFLKSLLLGFSSALFLLLFSGLLRRELVVFEVACAEADGSLRLLSRIPLRGSVGPAVLGGCGRDADVGVGEEDEEDAETEEGECLGRRSLDAFALAALNSSFEIRVILLRVFSRYGGGVDDGAIEEEEDGAGADCKVLVRGDDW